MLGSRTTLSLLGAALLSLSGCGEEDYVSHFDVAVSADSRQASFTPQGTQWAPARDIDISIFAEPQDNNGEISSTGAWRPVGRLNSGPSGGFGFDRNAFNFAVPRRICGSPPPWLPRPIILARRPDSGLVRTQTVDPANWFTYQPCH